MNNINAQTLPVENGSKAYSLSMGVFFISLVIFLIGIVDIRRAFLLPSDMYALKNPFLALSSFHVFLLSAGASCMFFSTKAMQKMEANFSRSYLEDSLKIFTFVLFALLVLDLFLYRGVAAARAVHAGKISADWLNAFGVSGFLKPVALSLSYTLVVWHATFLSVLFGGLSLAILPRYLYKYFSRSGLGGSVFGAMFALPQPFCSCCASMVAPSYARQGASTQFLLSFVVGAPMLNVTTLFLAASLLPFPYAVLRIAAGVLFTVPLTLWIARITMREVAASGNVPNNLFFKMTYWLAGQYCRFFHLEELMKERKIETPGELISSWLQLSFRLGTLIVPVFLVWGIVTAALFEILPSAFGNNFLSVFISAFAGTIFMVSTWTEIPVALQMLGKGYSGPAAALLLTLPPVSLPCLMILGGTVGKFRVVFLLGAAVMVSGVLSGLLFL